MEATLVSGVVNRVWTYGLHFVCPVERVRAMRREEHVCFLDCTYQQKPSSQILMHKLQECTSDPFRNSYRNITQWPHTAWWNVLRQPYNNKVINWKTTRPKSRINLSLCPNILQLLCGEPPFWQETLSVQKDNSQEYNQDVKCVKCTRWPL